MKRLAFCLMICYFLSLLYGCTGQPGPESSGWTGITSSAPTASTAPSSAPSAQSSTAPSTAPTTIPSTAPSTEPTTAPTTAPTQAPTQPQVQPKPPVTQGTIVRLRTADYTYSDMTEDLQALQQCYPELLRLQTYGTSLDGRALVAATLGAADAPKQVIITAGMHAGEYINPYLVMLQLDYYLSNYETGTYGGVTFRELFSQVAFVVVPMVNPDGITMVQQGLNSVRSQELRDGVLAIATRYGAADVDTWIKTYWKCNAAGVDLNRNSDIFTWQDYNEYSGYVQQPDFQFFKGYSPDSEPETQALVALTESLSDPVASICVHSRGSIIYWRCYQDGAFADENRKLAQIAADVTGYYIIDENQFEPSYSNWTILAHGIPTLTVETGLYLPLPMDIGENIGDIYNRNRDLWAAIALEYGT